jgi:hypothetical protein
VFSKTTIVDAHGERPAFYNPLIAACQLINVAREGEEPDMWTAKEDCRWGRLRAQHWDAKTGWKAAGMIITQPSRRLWLTPTGQWDVFCRT